jgi:hypothetical protein
VFKVGPPAIEAAFVFAFRADSVGADLEQECRRGSEVVGQVPIS